MANTITVKVDGYDGRYLDLVCTQTPNGSAENSSTIRWTLSAKGGSVNRYATGPTRVIINGVTVYSKDRVSIDTDGFPVTKGSVSDTLVVKHDANGEKTLSVKLSTAIYYKAVTEARGEWTLDAIPRYAAITHSLHAGEETGVTIHWVSDSVVDALWYRLNNRASWTGIPMAEGKSGTYTIGGLEENTAYKIQTRVRRKDSQLTTDSSTLSVTTYAYPHCIETPNFVIGEEITLKFYNPLKRSITFRIVANGTVLPYVWGVSGTTYTGIHSEGVQEQLYSSIPNSKKGKYEVVVSYGDIEKTQKNDNTYTVDDTKCAPVFGAFSYQDDNAVTSALTGNDRALVKGHSVLYVAVSSAQKAVGRYGAAITKYVVTCDTLRKEIPYADTDVSAQVGVPLYDGVKRLNVRAYDSRGLSTLAYQDVVVTDYQKPVIHASAQRYNHFEARTTLGVNGTYAPLTIDGVNKNRMIKVSYRVREVGGEWSGLSEIPLSDDGDGAYDCEEAVLSLDNQKAFEMEIQAYDRLGFSSETAYVDVGQAVFFVSSNQRACYVNGTKIIMYDIVETWEGW